MKDVDLRCRINAEIKKNFHTLCKKQAINPSELMRKWVCDWIEKNKGK